MADEDPGSIRKQLADYDAKKPGASPEDEPAKLAAELAGSVGKVVEKATAMGLGLVEDVGLRILGALAPEKPGTGSAVIGTAASLLSRGRAAIPPATGWIAHTMTSVMVGGGFQILRTLEDAARPRRRPD